MVKINQVLLIFIIIIAVPQILTVLYQLENDFFNSFTFISDKNVCGNFSTWVLEKEHPDEEDKFYIRPLDVPSCIAFSFDLSSTNCLKFIVGIEAVSLADELWITVYEESVPRDVIVAKNNTLSKEDSASFNGTEVVNITFDSRNTTGYVKIVGQASENSTIKIKLIEKYKRNEITTVETKNGN